MSIDYPEHILLTGAGFTKNFGGFLATEMWSKIFNNSQKQNFPRIKDLLLKDLDYESIYHKVVNGDFTAEEKRFINDAILDAYASLDAICSHWTSRKAGYNAFGGGYLKPPIDAEVKRFCNQSS